MSALIENPWGLDARQIKTLEATIKHGRQKVTADALGVGMRGLEKRMLAIREKMGTHTMGCAVAWAIWRATGEAK